MCDLDAPIVDCMPPHDSVIRLERVSPRMLQPIPHSLNGHADLVRCVCPLLGGKLASCSDDKSIRIWDMGVKRCIEVLKGHTFYVYAICSLPGMRLVSGSGDRTVRIWDLMELGDAKVLQGHAGPVYCISNIV